jgi:NAD(P)-dependent dehydrogenase (short-subunit alcohol dehydrogenase family)
MDLRGTRVLIPGASRGIGREVEVPASTVAACVVRAVQSGRAHVRLPPRAAALSLLAGAPSCAVRPALLRVPRRT